jgi:Transposase and inactivated derivatives
MEIFELLEDYLIDQDDGLKKLLTWFFNLVMQLEAIEQSGAEPYERNEARTAQRNGYKERSLKTRVGELILKKPQFRDRSFKSCVFDKYSRVELALTNAIAESYLQGVSTRRIREVVAHLGVERLSASTVSRIAKELDGKIAEFLKRPIERPIPYIYVDASYFKVRDGGKYVTKAFLIVTGIRDDGYREILGARITDSESEGFWSGFFDELIDRGLKDVKLVVSDGHKGIQSAVQSRFLGATWQMCQVHFSRAVLNNIPNRDKEEVAEKLRQGFEDESKMAELAVELRQKRYSKSADTIDRFSQDIWNHRAFPKEHWKKIRTTNGLERINKELKRRSRVVGAFPNDGALLRLGVTILMDINEEWLTGRKYLSMIEE